MRGGSSDKTVRLCQLRFAPHKIPPQILLAEIKADDLCDGCPSDLIQSHESALHAECPWRCPLRKSRTDELWQDCSLPWLIQIWLNLLFSDASASWKESGLSAGPAGLADECCCIFWSLHVTLSAAASNCSLCPSKMFTSMLLCLMYGLAQVAVWLSEEQYWIMKLIVNTHQARRQIETDDEQSKSFALRQPEAKSKIMSKFICVQKEAAERISLMPSTDRQCSV